MPLADRSHRFHDRRRAGFTTVELLVVIAIIVLLISILLPVFSNVRARARTMTCSVNERSIALAIQSYATSNGGRLCSPRTDNGSNAPGTLNQTENTWVKASGEGLSGGLETVKSLENGVLYPYMDGAANAYKSPNDPTERVRSYSLNAYIGNQVCPDDWDCDTFVPVPADEINLRTSSMSQVPQPGKTLCVIVEESSSGYNRQGWIIDWYTPEWIDLPAYWDEGRVNVSYVDGSTATLNVFGQRFIDESTALGGNYVDPQGDGPWFVFRTMLLPGRCDPDDGP